MFTGLVEEIGIVQKIGYESEGYTITIKASEILQGLQLGDSVNINGACQTVTRFDDNSFTVNTIEETLNKTTLGSLRTADKVNLERAMRADARFGGHFVLGHVDATGTVVAVRPLSGSTEIEISYPESQKHLLVPVGSIAVDGVSLTIAKLQAGSFTVAIIPHTSGETTLLKKKINDLVNLEFDVLGKYVARMMGKMDSGGITEEWLREKGF